jgi:hypothetical protein
MNIYPPSELTLKVYGQWCQKRGIALPPLSKDGIFVGIPQLTKAKTPTVPVFVCACLLYPTDGPYVFGEHLVSNPDLPARVVHRGVERLIGVLKVYSATRGKYPLVVPQTKALERMLERQEFQSTGKPVFQAPPVFGPRRGRGQRRA